MMVRLSLVTLLASAAIVQPACAQEAVEILISRIDQSESDGTVQVEVRLLNGGSVRQAVVLPDRVEARLNVDGADRPVWLVRGPGTAAQINVEPGGFGSAQYTLVASNIVDGSSVSVPAWGARQHVAIRARAAIAPTEPSTAIAAIEAAPPTPPVADRSVGNAFLANLSAYEPIYAAIGSGTNSDARIQLSFKYQLFGSRKRENRPASLKDGLYFAYTQRMFWDVGAESSPFRNVDFQPELFYLSSPVALSDRATLSGQIGLRHESNGRDGAASRSLNTFYVAPMGAFSLGGQWRLSVAPRFWLYLGDLSDNPDIRRYRGNSGLFMEVGEVNGLRLSTSTRFNVSSGKGSIAADLSYPLRNILGGGPDFYLFAQSFTGYGENLLDYDKRISRLRIGVALVR